MPPIIVEIPWKRFRFVCIVPPGSQASIVFQRDGKRESSDPRFEVRRHNNTAIEVLAPQGLRENDDMVIECITASGEKKEISVTIKDTCRPGESQCRDGSCIRTSDFCDGKLDCPDGSDEKFEFCGGTQPNLVIVPHPVSVVPWTPFKFTCIAALGERPSMVFSSNKKPVEQDPRFTITRLKENAIEVSVPHGLVKFDQLEDRLECITSKGLRQNVIILVENPCGYSQLPCLNGECIPDKRFCNGQRDCSDGSDESREVCQDPIHILPPRGDVIVTPTEIVQRPWIPITFTCVDRTGGRPRLVFTGTRREIEGDPRFNVDQWNVSMVEVTAPSGLLSNTSIDCISSRGGSATVSITIHDGCGQGYSSCLDGRCLPSSRFCDGLSDCSDNSDEDVQFCNESKPSGVVVTPAFIQKPPWTPFSFVCVATAPNQRPEVVIVKNKDSVENDPRFRLVRINATSVQVTAPVGLRGQSDNVVFVCSVRSGESKNVTVNIDSRCGPGFMQCQDGRCRPNGDFCNRKPDCSDGSDEFPEFCQTTEPTLTFTPMRIHTQPWKEFRAICMSKNGNSLTLRFADDQHPVDQDPRYRVRRINSTSIEVSTPWGLRSNEDNTTIECLNERGDRETVEITVEQLCGPNHMQCQDGSCLLRTQFCDGEINCRDGSDELPAFCPEPTSSIVVTPSIISTKPWTQFSFLCVAYSPDNVLPVAIFTDGKWPVQEDTRFQVKRVNRTAIEISAPNGLRSSLESTNIECVLPSGEKEVVSIKVEDICGPGHLPCRNRVCLPSHLFCNAQSDCIDASDELNTFCPATSPRPSNVRLSPSQQRVRPGQLIRLECTSLLNDSHVRPIIEFANGIPVDMDPQFKVNYFESGRVVITIPQDTEVPWRTKEFQCYLPGGSKERAEVIIDKNCEIGQRRCDDGHCLYVGQFCDGKIDCNDGSDELSRNCDQCDPISKRCEVVNGKSPKIPFYQEHWRCDGENDCGNGYDEMYCSNFTRIPGLSCGGPHFKCSGSTPIKIPIAYQCDGQKDCPDGEDEIGCMRPTILNENWQTRKEIRHGETLTLECEVLGVPPPTVIWRFNWGCLPNPERTQVVPIPNSGLAGGEEGVSSCTASRSRLTVENFQEGDDGIYNCEGLSGIDRALSQDVFVILTD